MPTYEYECSACGHRFEKFQLMKAEPIKECPVCKGAVRKLISGGGGIIFKGSGFYHTDYKKASSKTKEPSTGAEKKPETSDTPKPGKPVDGKTASQQTKNTKSEH